ncbi:MAG: hypothetical protein M1383_02930 [Patescibacteria group bacterium]|nr:hypothetical protein [Patescibacteria group bacterium]
MDDIPDKIPGFTSENFELIPKLEALKERFEELKQRNAKRDPNARVERWYDVDEKYITEMIEGELSFILTGRGIECDYTKLEAEVNDYEKFLNNSPYGDWGK